MSAEEEIYAAAWDAVMAMDQQALDRTAFQAGVNQLGETFQETTARALVVAPHDVQQYWLGECTCHRDTPQVKIVTCRPVTFQPELEELNKKRPDLVPQIYPDSVVGECSACGTPVYIGPRQQRALEANDTMIVMCMLCTVMSTAAQADTETVVTSFGNPFGRLGR